MEFKKIVMSKKQTYRIRNWKQYNESLVQRGSLTFWIDEEAIHNNGTCAKELESGVVLYCIQILLFNALYC